MIRKMLQNIIKSFQTPHQVELWDHKKGGWHVVSEAFPSKAAAKAHAKDRFKYSYEVGFIRVCAVRLSYELQVWNLSDSEWQGVAMSFATPEAAQAHAERQYPQSWKRGFTRANKL